ncbi:MAG: type II toxin-antitoxin system RelE/ParE family toxin [Sulfuricurvum sp.]|nr:type II toxin-antitoxin system RelE/ParE family toxin [Sulfuricurvum sp.]MDD5385605.1 type II toxin-antitoxin system RelE/ParE family toxin [Sulfuricurvum sp.]
MKIIYSPRFEREALRAYAFIAQDKRKAAKEFFGKVKAHIETLTDNPRKGRLSDDGNRELIHKGYTIPYLVDDESIVILGIFNQNEWIPKYDQETSKQ